MPPVVQAVAAAGAAASGAAGAFKYNRDNYLFDAGLRFSRYVTGYNMLIAQVSQYREDIRDMTEFTVTKADTYHTVGTICFVLNFQLIMAGRLGVHGPSPPGWLLGLYWTNICSALMFLVTFTWMAMHSGARATAGGAFMLTRSVRLPVPDPKQMDQARRTGNSFEKQRVVDVFRIPFVTPAPVETEEDPETGVRVPVSNRRIPRWYRDEVKDLRPDEGGASPGGNSNPEHFELYRGLQEEWWGYDVYSRIGILFFFSHWLAAAGLYSMCHVFTELRMVWPAWTVTALFATAHYGVLSLDIVGKPRVHGMNVPMEKVVPWVPLLAVLGMTLDYSVISPNDGVIIFIYLLAWICYIIQFMWALRLYTIASPVVRLKETPEAPGQAWWPMEWPVPPAFQNSVYLVSAPKNAEPGQTCLLQEMNAAKAGKGAAAPLKKARQSKPAMLPWKLFRGACITSISMWVLIMVGRAFEQVNGERQLLKQEGRVMRWPSHMQPWMAPWTRLGSRNEMCHTGGCDRRLSENDSETGSTFKHLISVLSPIADAVESVRNFEKQHSRVMRQTGVSWPTDLKPALLAFAGETIAAIARTHEGATIHPSGDQPAVPFAFQGLHDFGDILGASWGKTGVVLISANGLIAECPNSPREGAWHCNQITKPISLGATLKVATASKSSTGVLRAAAITTDGDSIVLLEYDLAADAWVPTGEVRAPFVAGKAPELSFAANCNELIISMADGHVVQRSVTGPSAERVVATPSPANFNDVWHGACSLGGDVVARLAAPGMGMKSPMLFVTSAV